MKTVLLLLAVMTSERGQADTRRLARDELIAGPCAALSVALGRALAGPGAPQRADVPVYATLEGGSSEQALLGAGRRCRRGIIGAQRDGLGRKRGDLWEVRFGVIDENTLRFEGWHRVMSEGGEVGKGSGADIQGSLRWMGGHWTEVATHDASSSMQRAVRAAPFDRPECRDRTSDAYYFPEGWMGERTERFDADQFARHWYSAFLREMDEPSLSCGDGEGDAFRFLWLRTWGRPIAVRLHRSSGGASLFAVELDGAGGYEPGKVSRRIERKLTEAEWKGVEDAARRLAFAELPAQTNETGLDGAQWILEGRGSRYHVVDRWSPKEGPFLELCLSLLKLADWLPTGKEKGDAIY